MNLSDEGNMFIIIGILTLGVGMLIIAGLIYLQSIKREKSLRRIDQLVRQRRQLQGVSLQSKDMSTSSITGKLDDLGETFSKTKAFGWFVEEEDRTLLGRAGFGTDEDLQRFVLIRLGLVIAGAVLLLVFNGAAALKGTGLIQFISVLGLGFMAPKWLLKSVADSREQAFERELVAVVDVMRLLQGVGLSVDQSLEVIATQLRELVPISGRMLYKAKGQVQSGVTWNTILKKMSEVYTSVEFRSFVAVIGQIEKYGGAVQEPLRQFSERLIEKERANAKETIGKLTVKITGVMVVTMLPALLIVAGGPGVIAMSNTF
ncbi:MAG: type II secretion system F family protein [Limnobacter sp.]|nr:type II secretion system F family protein [Limnobacter sp.]